MTLPFRAILQLKRLTLTPGLGDCTRYVADRGLMASVTAHCYGHLKDRLFEITLLPYEPATACASLRTQVIRHEEIQ